MSRRLALVIGNDSYLRNQLQNCVNDATDIAKTLVGISYVVTLRTNLKSEQMYQCIKSFILSIRPNDFIIFFFAGHGLQWGDQNFLLPCDNDKIDTGDDMQRYGINAQWIVNKMAAVNPHVVIVLLDCCRNYWIPNQDKRTDHSLGGLHEMRAPSGTIIAFACGAGKRTSDQALDSKHGIFTKYLLQHMTTPNLDIDVMLRRVTKDIAEETKHEQEPYRVSSIMEEDVYLVPSILGTQVISHITNNTQWKQHGITVAGGNDEGNKLYQLQWPYGLSIDNDQQAIYIADFGNDRIVEWKFNAQTGQVIAGGNGQGNQIHQLSWPTDVIVDTKNNSLIICDMRNRRVIEWSRQISTKIGQILISDIDCYGITMDRYGYIYVSDTEKNEVRRWKRGEVQGTVVAGGNGKGSHLNQLNSPTYLFVDQDVSVYVSDQDNHRVMKWIKNAKEGVIVAGGQGEGNQLTQLNCPSGIIVNHLSNVYVADSVNHRIMCWSKGSKQGRIIVGGNGKGKQSNQLNNPRDISFDGEDNLYVVDWSNDRVQKFEIYKY